MSESRKGFVEKIFKNEGKSAKGPWFAISFKICDENNTVDPTFYQLGFNVECPFSEGDYISFDADPKDDKSMTFVKGSGKKVSDSPTRAAGQSQKPSGGASSGGGAKVKESDLFGEIGGYNTEDDISRMTYSVARGHAIELVGILLEHDALPSSVAKSKAGQASRFEEANAFVDKKTIEFYYDGGLRKLDTVADAGVVDTSPDAAVPETADDEPEAVTDDAPPPADDGDESF